MRTIERTRWHEDMLVRRTEILEHCGENHFDLKAAVELAETSLGRGIASMGEGCAATGGGAPNKLHCALLAELGAVIFASSSSEHTTEGVLIPCDGEGGRPMVMMDEDLYNEIYTLGVAAIGLIEE